MPSTVLELCPIEGKGIELAVHGAKELGPEQVQFVTEPAVGDAAGWHVVAPHPNPLFPVQFFEAVVGIF